MKKYKFVKSNEMKIDVFPSQKNQISSKNKIKENIKNENVLAFDVYDRNNLIAFVMLREFEENQYFLWNFAIDKGYQNRGYGQNILKALIDFLKQNYNLKKLTTTYKIGNQHAKYIYEKIGFKEKEIDNEMQEINMELM